MAEASNYWETTVKRAEITKQFELPENCDVVIIGGGFNGVSTAYHLARRGVAVVLLEDYEIGWGASGRNGGMALTGLKESASTLVQKYGLEKARAYFHASVDAVELVRGLIKEENLRIDLSETGHIEVASKPSHFQAFIQEQKLLREQFSHSVDLLSTGELVNEIGASKYHGGIFDSRSLSLNPLQFVTELGRVASKNGAKIFENLSANKIEQIGGKHQVSTNDGTITCDHLVLCTSAYSDHRLQPRQKSHLKIGSYVLATEPLSFDGSELIRQQRSVYDTLNFLSYYRITADNRLLFGGRAVFAPESDENIQGSEKILREMMLDVYPNLKNLKMDYVWGGTLDVTINKMPSFATRNNVTFSIGFAGHGISIATYFGQQIARSILGDDQKCVFQTPITKTVPFWALRKVYLPFVEKYYRYLDKIN